MHGREFAALLLVATGCASPRESSGQPGVSAPAALPDASGPDRGEPADHAPPVADGAVSPDGGPTVDADASAGRADVPPDTATPAGTLLRSMQPISITSARDGTLWFTTRFGPEFNRLTVEGMLAPFPYRHSDGSPVQPERLTAGPDGNVWALDVNDWIYRVTPSGQVTRFERPASSFLAAAITAGSNSDLWFTYCPEVFPPDPELTGDSVGRITTSGTVTSFRLTPRAPDCSESMGITNGPDGNLWLTRSATNSIVRLTPNGAATQFPIPTSRQSLGDIVAGPDGNLWFSERGNNKVGKVTPAGEVTELIVPSSMEGVVLIAAGRSHIWVANYQGQIGRLATDGQFTPVAKIAGASSLTEGPDGHLWFLDSYRGKYGRVTADGAVLDFTLPEGVLGKGSF